MEFLVATGVGLVTATGIYLMLRGRSFPVVLGLSLFGYAVNVFIFLMGRLWTNASPILVRRRSRGRPAATGAGADRHRDRFRHHRFRGRACAAQSP
jgi:multisubunit Na+/H+ antiporter MnhC subunit